MTINEISDMDIKDRLQACAYAFEHDLPREDVVKLLREAALAISNLEILMTSSGSCF